MLVFDHQRPRARHDLDAPDIRATDDNRRRSHHGGKGGRRADLNDELARCIENALLVAARVGFRHFDQLSQTDGLVLP